MIQTLGVFSDLTLVWENPVRSLLGVMQLINLDFNIVKIQCYVQVDNPAMNVLAMVLLIPALAVGGALVAAVMSRVKGDQFSWPRYLNVVGLVFLFLYLSICMSLTRPVHCKRNPNGLQTMVSSPAVVCWVPDHMFLATLAITGLVLYGAGFLAYVAQIVWRYPALVNSGHGMKLLVQYHFLFNRFNGNGYYWGLYFIMQKVFVALVPILFPNSAAVQILLLAAFIMLYLVSVTYVTPWVTGLANFADIFLNAGRRAWFCPMLCALFRTDPLLVLSMLDRPCRKTQHFGLGNEHDMSKDHFSEQSRGPSRSAVLPVDCVFLGGWQRCIHEGHHRRCSDDSDPCH